jgi:predicted amino acid-binding ACT domain protein
MTSLVASRSTSLWWTQAKSIPMKYPMAFGIVLSGFKTSFSDLMVQKVIERKEKVDWKRNAAFAAFGFVYLGGVQYMIYVPFFGRVFPAASAFAAKPLAQKVKDVKGMMQLTAQVFLDQCVHHPVLYFPAFYCTKELVMNSEKPDFARVLSEYRQNIKEDLQALWKIWVPAMFFNFSFMPMHLRIPFVAGVSLLWTMVLSATRGGDVVHGDDLVGGSVTGSTYSLVKEGLDERFNMTPVELDSNLIHINLSAAGRQRPGLVALLARHVADYQGNITHSKMVRLGQEFIIQMHIALPPEQHKEFMKSIKARKNKVCQELDIQTTRLSRRDTNHEKAVVALQILCIGDDRYVCETVCVRVVPPGFCLSNVEVVNEQGFIVRVVENAPAHGAFLDRILSPFSRCLFFVTFVLVFFSLVQSQTLGIIVF